MKFKYCTNCDHMSKYIMCLFINIRFKCLFSKENLLFTDGKNRKCRKLLKIKHI